MSAETVIDVVGATPLVRLEHLVPHNGSEVWVKLEGNNPAGSIKDRAARSMIEEAEKRGDIKPGDALVEATSGNTGIALAMIAALKGYRMKIILPANSTAERCAAIQAYGAELILSPAEKAWRVRATWLMPWLSAVKGGSLTNSTTLTIRLRTTAQQALKSGRRRPAA